MYKIIFVCVLGLFVSCENSNPFYLKSDLEREGLEGAISSIKTYNLRKNRKGVVDTVAVKYVKYNNNGFTDSMSLYTFWDEITNYKKYYYSKNNKLDSVIGGNQHEDVKVYLSYDNGVLVEQKDEYTTKERINVHYSKYMYDHINNKLKKKVYKAYTIKEADTTKNFYRTAYYNNRGFVDYTENIYFKRKQNQRVMVKNIRDAKGLIREYLEYNEKDELVFTRKYSYVYDEKENWIEAKTFVNGALWTVRTRDIAYN